MLSKRLFSTSSRQLTRAAVSRLGNGITVITKPSETATPSVGLFLNSGSRSEDAYSSGISTLLGHVVSASQSAADALKTEGVKYYSSNQKEVTGILSASYPKGNSTGAFTSIKNTLAKLDSIVSDEVKLADQKAKSIAIADAFEDSPKDMVIEHMIGTAFQGTSLALPKYGKSESLEILESQDLKNYLGSNLVSSNLAIVSVGSEIDHDSLIKFASELPIATGAKKPFASTSFLGSDIRLRDDNLPQAHAAISVLTPGFKETAAFYTGLVAAQINGSYSGIASPYSSYVGSTLAQFLEENHLVDSFDHFQLAYSDVGLWGGYFASHNIGNYDETIHFALKNWNRFSSGTVNEIELSKAKSELKLRLLKAPSSSVAFGESLATQAFGLGYIPSEQEVAANIDEVTSASVTAWAQKYLYDQDIAVAGNGQIEALFDYNRLRNDMSMMRW
ncbi:Cytochrome b-c1 complex subunit 1, mitochondrial [Pichia californica]|uniref:Cytochrome b-c1 complex subunit 1, mitochondrial n=1 Tax=Pichia californica TaxID=460514 RepID=A0A9P6WHJ0_9ASCO|nr:Cytochrome b-c1 complex subunit 1, mitochondrial [[Candida] californica]KAG0686864.1 Cytochrome b-c1 complex subunit 1, mitochondrial [[Candida] californica]